MNHKKWLGLFFVLIGVVLVVTVMSNDSTKVVEAQGCSGQLSMEPTEPYTLGTHVILRGTSNCGTVRFEIRNPSTSQSWTKAEIGSNNQTETWKTEEFGSGTFEVCFVARGSGGWENAHRSCRTVFVEGGQAPPSGSEPGQQVRCWVNSFVATPATVQIGSSINLASQGQCDGNMRAARYTIDGQGWGEHATTTYNTGWNTSGYGVGTHRLCYQITGGDWADAAESCVTVTLQSESAPPPAPVTGPQNTNDVPGQTQDSDPSMIDHPQGDPPSGSDGVCPANKPDNLSVGMIAVTVDRVNLREQPDSNSNRIMRIPRGTLVTIIGGPICNRGQRWQHVGHDGQQGWVLENEGRGYWLVPNGSALVNNSSASSDSGSSGSSGQNSQGSSQSGSNNSCSGAIASHMQVGQRGRVTYTDGSPTNLRNQPGGSVLMAMPEGFEFMVVGGPTCLNDMRWWQLRTDSGTTGWSPEGRDGMYWIEPWSGSSGSTPPTNSGSANPPRDTNASQCYKAMSPLFSMGSIGQVAINDGIGSHIQAAPSQRPDLLFLNEGQQFTVVGGPTCADGFRWWQVTAQGVTGWIAEGDENGYWLAGVTGQNPVIQQNQRVRVDNFGMTYWFEVNPRTCAIVNGDEIVQTEIQRFEDWFSSLVPAEQALNYFWYFTPEVGGIDRFRQKIEEEITSATACHATYYLVDDLYMDTSGLGNIVFGYFSRRYPEIVEDAMSHLEQGANTASFLHFWDNPDDASQRRTGREIAEISENSSDITPSIVSEAAQNSQLR